MKRVNRPCDECPFRRDAESGRFEPERWAVLVGAGSDDRGFGPEFGAPVFACHKTPEGGERACAGFLATEGNRHPRVRLAVALGGMPPEALSPGGDWPDLFATVREAAAHDLSGRD